MTTITTTTTTTFQLQLLEKFLTSKNKSNTQMEQNFGKKQKIMETLLEYIPCHTGMIVFFSSLFFLPPEVCKGNAIYP